MFILDSANCRVVRWTNGDPISFLVAGSGSCGSSLTQIDLSYGMFIDQQLNIYISEYNNHRVTLWTPADSSYGILVCFHYFN